MDGLLIDSEDKYTLCTNTILARYNRPPIPWSIKAQLQGRPGPAAGAIFDAWAQLPISREEYLVQALEIQEELFPQTKPLRGVEELLRDLDGKVEMALATSSHRHTFGLKTGHLSDVFDVFPEERRVLGDDERIPKGRGKPAPDIYLLALKTINDTLKPGQKKIVPEECLVFEDSVPGVEAGRRAGMRCVWVPHPELKGEYKGREKEVLAGRTGEGEGDLHQVGEVDDGWAEYLETLEDFPYARYGIVV